MGGYHMGINLGHDRSVAVVKDGEILVAIEQERLDREEALARNLVVNSSRILLPSQGEPASIAAAPPQNPTRRASKRC